ncbi:hypothetical protein JHK85_010566 [Glycine max]|nr:hypothetical protein JHK85_010566 [Glycine max]
MISKKYEREKVARRSVKQGKQQTSSFHHRALGFSISRMGNLVDQDQQWLLSCLSTTLDPNPEVRCFTEASLD